MQVGMCTFRGRRRENQDAIRVEMLRSGRLLAALADGMGGHQGGAHASHRALDVLVEGLHSGVGLQTAVSRANDVLNEDAKRPDLVGMGTTVVGVLLEADGLTFFNVGDSRGYQLGEHGIKQVTEDHSFVAEAVRSGQMTLEDAEGTRYKNALTRSLGGETNVLADLFGPFTVEENSAVVLCSDGVYKVLSDEEIDRLVRSTRTAADAATALAHAAFRQGSDDNVSAIVLESGTLRRSGVTIAVDPAAAFEADTRDGAFANATADRSRAEFAWPDAAGVVSRATSASRPDLGIPVSSRAPRRRRTVLRWTVVAAVAVLCVAIVSFRVATSKGTTSGAPAQPSADAGPPAGLPARGTDDSVTGPPKDSAVADRSASVVGPARRPFARDKNSVRSRPATRPPSVVPPPAARATPKDSAAKSADSVTKAATSASSQDSLGRGRVGSDSVKRKTPAARDRLRARRDAPNRE